MHLKPTATLLQTIANLSLLLLLPVCYFPLGCSVSASGAVSSAVQQGQAAYATGLVPASFFGMVVKAAASPPAQPAVPTGARRLWDAGVTWAALEPAAGSFAWTALDAEVAAAAQAGADITLTLGMTPTWASSTPGTPSAYGNGATAMPANLADWDSYVAAVAARYRGRIHAYEVWNAPEDTLYWTGDPARVGQDMASLAARTASTVHTLDADAMVVSPALSPAGLDAFLTAGGGASVDAIGISLGSTDTGAADAPEAMADKLPALRAALAGTGAAGKPLWNDQASWLLPPGSLSANMQAAYVARALVLNAGLGVQRIHWYAWDDHAASALALSTVAGQPTAAAAAFGEVEQWLTGAQLNGCAASAAGVWTCQLVRAGATAWIVWSPNGTLRNSAYGATKLTMLDGTVGMLDGSGAMEAGPSPVLLQ